MSIQKMIEQIHQIPLKLELDSSKLYSSKKKIIKSQAQTYLYSSMSTDT